MPINVWRGQGFSGILGKKEKDILSPILSGILGNKEKDVLSPILSNFVLEKFGEVRKADP
jgi:hypothetical protein